MSVDILPVAQFVEELDRLCQTAEQAFQNADSEESLEVARVEFLGAKSGQFKVASKRLAQIAPTEKKIAGQKINEVKRSIEAAHQQGKLRLESGQVEQQRDPQFDPTLPGQRRRLGRLHPITQTINELKDIMGRLGFTPADGPEIEDTWHNFEALNIPTSHPARDPLDNFYLSVASQTNGEEMSNRVIGQGAATNPVLLRSQTSTVQIRVMEHRQPPVRIISLGRVYRPDTADWSHYPMFHQIEGLMVDHQVSLADLKTVLKLFATSYLGNEVPIRIRPSFFPFTEPSVEADYFWDGKWVEFGGAGIVDPNVLTSVGYDPEKVSGFAFGLGIERLCMIRHQISDIRHLFTNDVRFLRQF